jgi:hypothetical protein
MPDVTESRLILRFMYFSVEDIHPHHLGCELALHLSAFRAIKRRSRRSGLHVMQTPPSVSDWSLKVREVAAQVFPWLGVLNKPPEPRNSSTFPPSAQQ